DRGEPADPALRRGCGRRRAARVGADPRRRRAVAGARPGGDPACAVRRLDGTLALLGDRPEAGCGPAALLLPAVRAARHLAGAAALAPEPGSGALRRAGRDGSALRRGRAVPARRTPRVLEPEGDRRERLPVVLPRQL